MSLKTVMLHMHDEETLAQFAERMIVECEKHRTHAEAMCRVAEDVTAERDQLRHHNENLRSVMVAAAEEISEHWEAHCDADGYGPVNLMARLENGIPSEYAYKAGDFRRLRGERDQLRSQVKSMAADNRELTAEVERLTTTRSESGQYWRAQFIALQENHAELEAEVERLRGSAEPVAYKYEFTDPISGSPCWRFDAGHWNGQQPKSSRPLYEHPPVPDGYAIVPAWATESQVAAGYEASLGKLHSYDEAEAVYSAMLDAAPQPGDNNHD
jgi:hypothetical protein